VKLRHIKGDCDTGPCPTLYETDRGSLIVQGYIVDDREALEALRLPVGETAVEIPRELLQNLELEMVRDTQQ
jgi:hypothetical protein